MSGMSGMVANDLPRTMARVARPSHHHLLKQDLSGVECVLRSRNLAETMENQPNQHNSQSSDKEPQLPFYADLSDRLNFS